MRLEYWIYFDKPDEKKQLTEVVESSKNDFEAIQKIQENFNVDMFKASKVLEIYKSKIRK